MLPWWAWAIASAIFVAIMLIIKKKILLKEHAMQYEATQKMFMFFLMLLLLPNVNLQIDMFMLISSLLIGFGLAIGGLFVAKAYRHMPISEAAPLKNLSPAMVLFFAFIFLGEKPSRISIGGILFLLLGAYILESKNNFADLTEPIRRVISSRYIHYMITGLILYTFTAIGAKVLLVTLDPISLLFFVMIGAGITDLTLLHIYHNGINDIKKAIKNYGTPIFITAILGILVDLTLFQAMTTAYVSLVIPIKRLSTLFVTLIGGELFHEKNLGMKAIACIIMLIGATMVVS